MRLAAAGVLLALVAHADIITLKDGRVINGTYVGGTPRQIKVEVGDQVETLDVASIARIEFSNGSTSSASSTRSAPQSDSDRPTLRRGASSGDTAGPLTRSSSPPVMVNPDPDDPRTQSGQGGGGSYASDRPTLKRSAGSSSDSTRDSSGTSSSSQPTSSTAQASSDRPTLRRAPGSDSDASSRPQQTQQTAQPAQSAPAQPATPAQPVVIPAQTNLVVRTVEAIDSEKAQEGQTFVASLDQPVALNGQTVLPQGSDVIIKLVQVQQSGKLTGKAELTVSLWSVKVGSKFIDVDTQNITQASASRGAQTAKVAGGAAAAGAVIGAIAGGGKGAAIGAGAGAAGGTAVQAATKGQRVKIAPETLLTFTLEKPVSL
jgi:hypothetical protein